MKRLMFSLFVLLIALPACRTAHHRVKETKTVTKTEKPDGTIVEKHETDRESDMAGSTNKIATGTRASTESQRVDNDAARDRQLFDLAQELAKGESTTAKLDDRCVRLKKTAEGDVDITLNDSDGFGCQGYGYGATYGTGNMSNLDLYQRRQAEEATKHRPVVPQPASDEVENDSGTDNNADPRHSPDPSSQNTDTGNDSNGETEDSSSDGSSEEEGENNSSSGMTPEDRELRKKMKESVDEL